MSTRNRWSGSTCRADNGNQCGALPVEAFLMGKVVPIPQAMQSSVGNLGTQGMAHREREVQVDVSKL